MRIAEQGSGDHIAFSQPCEGVLGGPHKVVHLARIGGDGWAADFDQRQLFRRGQRAFDTAG